jgi:hypothetical protein
MKHHKSHNNTQHYKAQAQAKRKRHVRPKKKLTSLLSLKCDVPMQPEEASLSDSEDGDDSIPMLLILISLPTSLNLMSRRTNQDCTIASYLEI